MCRLSTSGQSKSLDAVEDSRAQKQRKLITAVCLIMMLVDSGLLLLGTASKVLGG
jgi:hypothetical protein